ncbi:MAG: alkaline phosphatase family protein [Planctomycetaceae bacterium]|nr:alkaline phosphatase family protein [Planctomycetaceae bacterium]
MRIAALCVALAALLGMISLLASDTISAAPASGAKSKHVLVIGIDGCMPDAVQAAKAPNIKALAAAGTVTWDGFSGGVLGTPSRQNTKSMPSWNSVLMGVWCDKHLSISYRKWKPNHAAYPNMFQRLKAAKPDARSASIVTWKEINVDYRMTPGADYQANGKDDDATTALAVKHLTETNPDLVFIQLDQVDGAGEGNGFSPKSPKYMEAVEKADTQVGQLVEAVKKRKTYANEEWLIILVTDHGGTYRVNKDPKTGKEVINGSHGSDTPEERKIFVIVSGEAAKKQVVSPGPGLTVVAPTALHFLGAEYKPEWKLDGEPFGLKDYTPAK